MADDASMGAMAATDMSTQADRAAVWSFLRSMGDVFELPGGAWMLTSPEAVRYAHRNPDLFANAGMFDVHDLPVRPIPVSLDPPEHQRFRKVLDPMLAPRVIDSMEDELRVTLRGLIAGFASDGSCDVVADLARCFPTDVFLRVFGLPVEDREQLLEWVETVIEKSPQLRPEFADESRAAAWKLHEYFRGYVEAKRRAPGDDMLGRILALEGDDAWSDDDAVGLCVLFSMAGLDTVAGAIGFTFLHLAQDRRLRESVVADPALVGPFVEEVLRLEPPAPFFPRRTTQDVEVCGVAIPADARVMLCFASVNRDTERYEHPDEVDLEQGGRGHLAFGGGIHRCLGSHLARRELRLVVEEFHALIPDYGLEPGFEPEVVWPSGTLHLRSLPLVFPPAA